MTESDSLEQLPPLGPSTRRYDYRQTVIEGLVFRAYNPNDSGQLPPIIIHNKYYENSV